MGAIAGVARSYESAPICPVGAGHARDSVLHQYPDRRSTARFANSRSTPPATTAHAPPPGSYESAPICPVGAGHARDSGSAPIPGSTIYGALRQLPMHPAGDNGARTSAGLG